MKLLLWKRAEEERIMKRGKSWKKKNKINKDLNLEENRTNIFLSLSSDIASVEKNKNKKNKTTESNWSVLQWAE